MTNKSTAHKTKTIGVRVTADENKLFVMLAQEQGVSISEFMRNAIINYAQMTLEHKELLNELGLVDVNKSGATFHSTIEETREIICTSITTLNDRLSGKVDRIEKLIDAFLYAYLFHTPEVNDENKNNAKQSAVIRKKRVLALMEKDSS